MDNILLSDLKKPILVHSVMTLISVITGPIHISNCNIYRTMGLLFCYLILLTSQIQMKRKDVLKLVLMWGEIFIVLVLFLIYFFTGGLLKSDYKPDTPLLMRILNISVVLYTFSLSFIICFGFFKVRGIEDIKDVTNRITKSREVKFEIMGYYEKRIEEKDLLKLKDRCEFSYLLKHHAFFKEEIPILLSVLKRDKQAWVEENGEVLNCSVCYLEKEDEDYVYGVPFCKHIYCHGCFQKNYVLGEETECSVCGNTIRVAVIKYIHGIRDDIMG